MKICPDPKCKSESKKEWGDEVKFCLVVNSETRKICGVRLIPK